MWKYLYEKHLDMGYLSSTFDENFINNLTRCLLERPSRVDYLVKRWRGATLPHKKRLYLAILCGVPIQECLDWGVKYDNFEYDDIHDRDLSDFEFPYLDSKGEAEFMSWEGYNIWLQQQKDKEGDFSEEKYKDLGPLNEFERVSYDRARTWGDWNKESFVAD